MAQTSLPARSPSSRISFSLACPLLQLPYQVILAIQLLLQEFGLPFQALDLLGIGHRL
jgi:hypothetical protein